MDIQVLANFLAVVREGTICGAARSVYMTQPALTRQMKALEDELGTKLFHRGRRGIVLTEEGRFLEKRASELLSLFERTKRAFLTSEDNLAGDVAIAAGETRAMLLLAHTATRMRKMHPNVAFHLTSGNGDDVKERIDKGLCDFGLFIEPVDLGKYEYVRLPIKDTWGVLMPRDHPLAAKDFVEPPDLRGIELVTSRQTLVLDNEIAGWLGEGHGKIQAVCDYNLLYNASLVVEAGMGLALCLDGIVRTDDTSPLVFRPLKPEISVGVCLAWKKGQVFSCAAARFLALAREDIAAWKDAAWKDAAWKGGANNA